MSLGFLLLRLRAHSSPTGCRGRRTRGWRQTWRRWYALRAPFLLTDFREMTGGESLRVNVAIIRQNAWLAARIANAYAALGAAGSEGAAVDEVLP